MWLWCARVLRQRNDCAGLVAAGGVRINRQPTEKPHARLRPGDVITAVTRLSDYHEREGRHGLMLFTIMEDTWTNQLDEVVKRSRSTLIRY